jgi:glycosyltransferase involved in cell wall biosynthesis
LTIPNGRDVERLGACSIADVREPTKTLTFVGFVSRRKNQAYLVEVMSHLPPTAYRLQIVGDVLEPDYHAQIVQQAQDRGLQNISFVGSVPHSEIPALLGQTHAFVSASKMEVQSLSIIEALASGTPVVGLSNETIDELVDERVGFCLNHDASPQAFAARVREICRLTPAEYAALCQNARQRVAHLGWAEVQERTIVAYAQLIERRRHKSDEQIVRAIERISSEQIQQILFKRVLRLNRTLRKRFHPHSRLGLISRMTYANQISQTTWFYVGLTRFVSSFLGQISPLRRQWG